MTSCSGPFRRALVAAATVVACGAGASAHATNHALIMWIGDYGSPRLNLPGIDLDAANARRIAQAMGVLPANIREVSNSQLDRNAMARELKGLTDRIATDDKVFVYYSGHGHQQTGVGGARCTESLVGRGPTLYYDAELQAALTDLGNKASQVVVMNDSCFSGGAATKESGSRSADGWTPKFYPDDPKAGGTTITDGYQCGQAVNKMSRNLEPVAARTRVLYVAASSDTEVSFAGPNGSVATNAWARCIIDGSADTDRSGSISGAELQACAQRHVNASLPGRRQTISLQGDTALPLSFGAASVGGNGSVNRIDPVRALNDVRNGAAKDFVVSVSVPNDTLRIGQDYLSFSVTTARPGYLYVLQVGSDGRTFNLLYPNRLDQDNYVTAGSHTLPRPSWRVRAGGPAGTSHLLAVVSPTRKDFAKEMDASGTFATAEATDSVFKTLYVEASGAAGGSGGYGASEVVRIRETQ